MEYRLTRPQSYKLLHAGTSLYYVGDLIWFNVGSLSLFVPTISSNQPPATFSSLESLEETIDHIVLEHKNLYNADTEKLYTSVCLNEFIPVKC